jgi:hypothetical protein
MKARSAHSLLTGFVCLALLALSSAPASATTRNLLLIHGRTNSSGEQFGTLTTDQLGAWQGTTLATGANVYYVQWDAWNRYFDDPTCPGGRCIITNALNSLCSASADQMCWIICHSAGCAALENVFEKLNGTSAGSLVNVAHVIAASSAAGGSELADNGLLRYIGGLTGLSSTIDNSLKTSYARSAYNHNLMLAVVRGIAGTSNDQSTNIVTSCNFWPQQSGSYNSDCTACFNITTLSNWHQCDDGVVALHSTCGHNRVASFQNCNSTLSPFSDQAGTYADHGWWIADGSWNGPYSSYGQSHYNSSEKTYRVDHSAGKDAAINEYSAAPAALCP